MIGHRVGDSEPRGRSLRGAPAIPDGSATRAAVALLLAGLLAGCGADRVPRPDPPAPAPTITGTPTYDAGLEPAAAVLPFVPDDATTLTVTDLDKVRVQLGVPDLTSGDLVTDRSGFWARAEREAPLLTQGVLREDTSELMLDYGFTEDDVDWEAHFTGPSGNGYVLGLRRDLPVAGVERAVRDGVGALAGARVLPGRHLVVSGAAPDGSRSWAADPAVVDLLDQPAEASYVRRGCLPFDEALGPDATAADQARALAHTDVTTLDELDAFAVQFGDHLATVRMAPGRADLFDRLHLGDDWPRDVSPSFADGFAAGVGDPATGRIGYDVARPPVAARLALGETLPFAVCPGGVDPVPEPTGL